MLIVLELEGNVEGNLAMFLAIDVGGTKTLVAAFTQDGKISKSIKFQTPKEYKKFVSVLKAALARFETQKFTYACIAVPGRINRAKGTGIRFGNLDWENVPVIKDLSVFIKCPIVMENDANLGGLYEARNIIDDYETVVYITISTGIGSGIIINGILEPEVADSELGQTMLPYNGKLMRWEKFASGKAIKERYGKIAAKINDRKTWREISYSFALGINTVIATIQPDAIVIGGGVGTHFKKYNTILKSELKKFSTPLTPTPPILQAKKPEEAVIYGCYEMAKDEYEKSRK